MLSLVAAVVVTVAATGFDLATRRIPNFITVPAILGGALLAGVSWFAVSGVLAAIAVWAAVEATGRDLGGGDLKLLAAIGSLLGPLAVVLVALVASGVFLLLPRRIEQPVAPLILVGVLVFSIGALLC